MLRLVDVVKLHEAMQLWDDWLAHAPQSYMSDGFLGKVVPISVSCRYGQNTPFNATNADSREWWEKHRKFENIRYICVALASDIG
jgi:hypothetical protein